MLLVHWLYSNSTRARRALRHGPDGQFEGERD
jgi:hypothetical protein